MRTSSRACERTLFAAEIRKACQPLGLLFRELRILGWDTHWLLFFFVVSVVPAYLVKGLFGVEV